MANSSFAQFGETATRKPSKIRLVLCILVVFLLVLSLTFIALYLKEKSKAKSTDVSSVKQKTVLPFKEPTKSPVTEKTCTSSSCLIAAGILNKLDQSTEPCDDFYQYSCGGFLNKTDIPENEEYMISSFTKTNDFVQNALKEILQNKETKSRHTPNSAIYKAFTYYQSCMDDTEITSAGKKPLLDVIQKFGSWSITNNNWNEYYWKLETILAKTTAYLNANTFLSLSTMSSYFDNTKTYLTISGGISGYHERDLDRPSKSIPSKQNLNIKYFDIYKPRYKKFMSAIFQLLVAQNEAGTQNANIDISKEVDDIINMEREFLEVVEYLNPRDIPTLKTEIKYMSISELNALTSYKFDWDAYFTEALRGTGHSVSYWQQLMVIKPDNIKKVINWLTGKPKRLLANEIIWNLIRGLVYNLPKPFRDAQEKYFQLRTPTPRWKTCNALTDATFLYVTTLLYANKHLSEDAIKTAGEMFTEIKNEFVNGLDEQTWMDYETKSQARLKLNKMRDLIGFPAVIKEPGVLDRAYEDIQVYESKLLENWQDILRKFYLIKMKGFYKRNLEDFEKSSLAYLAINAYYNPQANGMTILAGILNEPFYKHDRLKAMNYGALGMVVGHEITHGFDKTGSEFDEKGNVRQWWSTKSHENFVKRSACLINEYSKINMFGYQVNGTRTLSENIADNGGLKYAYRAYQNWRRTNGAEKKLPGLSFTNDQLFFISLAQTWCTKYRKEKVKDLMDLDVHSLNPVRVRVPLHNFPEFSKAFGCPARKNTCTVW
ncbi:endothelin-converting enzyme homolog isoform X2 [Dendronephthya gigantea]|uniref:endothelin-converting enzyme homolog isoform X2 n=1 Tax=Dendronephthya gigantea TaxID=151771 RepID=UPI00106B24BF|nr:endothelin-converting enzyme homolog isoform X2 [Dendronephthya gigantea]